MEKLDKKQDKKQDNFLDENGKFDMSKCIDTNAIDNLSNKDFEKVLKILDQIKY